MLVLIERSAKSSVVQTTYKNSIYSHKTNDSKDNSHCQYIKNWENTCQNSLKENKGTAKLTYKQNDGLFYCIHSRTLKTLISKY